MFGDYTFENNISRKIIREIREALENKENWESWSLVFYGNDYLNVDYNLSVDNSTENTVVSGAFYRLALGNNGYVFHDDNSVFYPYVVDFTNTQWKEKFEEAAKQAFKELFDTVKTKQTVYGEAMTDGEFDRYVIAEVAHDWEHDARFKTKREMQQYNCGIAKAMRLVNAFLDCNEFHSPIFNQFRDMK